MTSHPDVETLAFFAEDLLEPDEERVVAAHTKTCATCSATLGELTGVSRILAAAPAPPLPQDVADLLDQRIADAVRERSAKGPALAPVPVPPATVVEEPAPATVVPLRRGHGGLGLPRLLVAAAVAVFVVGGGAAVVNGLMPTDEGSIQTSAPLDPPEGAGEAVPDTAQSYAEVVRSETVYTDAALPEQAAQVLELPPMGGEPGGDRQEEADTLVQEQSAVPGVDECATRLSETFGTRVTLVDDARYGPDAERVWVLYAPEGDRVDVYVVDPSCARGGDLDNSVLTQTTVDAP